MKQLSKILEGLLNNDISNVTAEGIVDEFWKLASDFGRGGSIRRDQAAVGRFFELLPAIGVWASDNARKIEDKNAWGIAIDKECFAILGDMNVFEFYLEDDKIKYVCINANHYLGTVTSTWNDIKRNFILRYEEQGCRVFWIDKKKVRLFKK